jgi:hypothetical protein
LITVPTITIGPTAARAKSGGRGAEQPAPGWPGDAPAYSQCAGCEGQLLGQQRLRLLFPAQLVLPTWQYASARRPVLLSDATALVVSRASARRPNGCSGSNSEVRAEASEVRSSPESQHASSNRAVRLWATFGLMHCKQGLPRSRGHRSCRDLANAGPVAATPRTRGKSVYPTTAAHKR